MIGQAIAIFDPLNRFMWSCVIILLYICSILYLFNGFSSSQIFMQPEMYFRTSTEEHLRKKIILKGIGFLFFGLANSRAFFFISDYLRRGYYIGHSYFPLNGGDPFLYNTFGTIGTINFLIGISIFYYYMIKLSNRLLVFIVPILINIFLGIWIIIGKDLMERLPTYIGVGLNSLFVLIIMGSQLSGENKRIRMIAYFLHIGIIFYLVGSVFDSGLIKVLNPIIPYLSPIYMIIGIIIIIVSISYFPQTYSVLKKTFITFTILFIFSISLAVYLCILIFSANSVDLIVKISLIVLMLGLFLIFSYILYSFNFSLKILEGKDEAEVSNFGKDLLRLILFSNKEGEIKYTRDLSDSHYKIIEDMNWENEDEKNEFIQYFFSISPKEREEILLRFSGKIKK